MKALRFHEYGGRDKLVVESVPDPVAGPGEVVVKVGACALNHLDVDFREGVSRFPLDLPLIMGLEIAGTIASRRSATGLLAGATGREILDASGLHDYDATEFAGELAGSPDSAVHIDDDDLESRVQNVHEGTKVDLYLRGFDTPLAVRSVISKEVEQKFGFDAHPSEESRRRV